MWCVRCCIMCCVEWVIIWMYQGFGGALSVWLAFPSLYITKHVRLYSSMNILQVVFVLISDFEYISVSIDTHFYFLVLNFFTMYSMFYSNLFAGEHFMSYRIIISIEKLSVSGYKNTVYKCEQLQFTVWTLHLLIITSFYIYMWLFIACKKSCSK